MMRYLAIVFAALMTVLSLFAQPTLATPGGFSDVAANQDSTPTPIAALANEQSEARVEAPDLASKQTAIAVFAGGCFWCMESPFDELDGVLQTTSGYSGGTVPAPSYKQVSSGTTGHAESVSVMYDPTKISYSQLLEVYWHNVDPLDMGGQFCDRGSQYRTAIFYTSTEQKDLAIASKENLEENVFEAGAIATEIQPAKNFYPAEDYHQNYYETHPLLYRYYRFRCGRDNRLEELWQSSH